MKLSQLKEQIKQVIRERGVGTIQKEYQKTLEEIEKALEFYKKNKLTDKKDAFVKVLKQLGEKKKALQHELDMKVQSMYRNAEYQGESVTEGKKAFKVNPGIGKAKYSISSHDGHKKHNDGSDFWDIQIFKNKVDLEKGIKDYKSKGFIEESVNEAFQKGKTYGGTKCEGGCFIGKQGLMKIIKISKESPKDVFMFRDDNYSGLQPHFVKDGVIAKATTINPSYDLEKHKVNNLKIGNDVILSVRLFVSTNESVSESKDCGCGCN